jgi:LPXTG-motif cell wall-anchored protein
VLPRTGGEIAVVVLTACALLTAGALMVMLRRRASS